MPGGGLPITWNTLDGAKMLRELLLDFAWLRAKLVATDPNALIGDYIVSSPATRISA